MKVLQNIRGTKDLLPEDFIKHDEVIKKAIEVSEKYGFKPFSTPIIEFTETFSRNLGESSDVVSKEMYAFIDRSGDSITLRPEFTAGVVRSFINNGLAHKLPFKCYSYGPVFRHERPQKARQRQFHQFNAEFFGASSPIHDAEVIKMAQDILFNLGINESRLELNSIGDLESRQSYKSLLVEFLSDFKDKLSEDSKTRLEKNPLRILDSKDESDKIILEKAPKIYESFNNESKERYEEVKYWLNVLDVKYFENSNLVRGLDYYAHTAFEFTTDRLGAQGTILAGGRYDGLVKQMGGEDVKAIGFGAGIERLVELYKQESFLERSLAIIPIGSNNELRKHALILANDLRSKGVKVECVISNNLSKSMKILEKINPAKTIFIGEEEVAKNMVKLKDMDSGEVSEVKQTDLLNLLNI